MANQILNGKVITRPEEKKITLNNVTAQPKEHFFSKYAVAGLINEQAPAELSGVTSRVINRSVRTD